RGPAHPAHGAAAPPFRTNRLEGDAGRRPLLDHHHHARTDRAFFLEIALMDLKGKRVLVVGLGESGLAMAKWLHRQGAVVRVADSRDNPPNVEALQAAAPGAELIAGPFAAASFVNVDLLALSPGVPKATPEIAAAGVPMISEIELFAAGVRQQVPG